MIFALYHFAFRLLPGYKESRLFKYFKLLPSKARSTATQASSLIDNDATRKSQRREETDRARGNIRAPYYILHSPPPR
jgi:hypothetical protein